MGNTPPLNFGEVDTAAVDSVAVICSSVIVDDDDDDDGDGMSTPAVCNMPSASSNFDIGLLAPDAALPGDTGDVTVDAEGINADVIALFVEDGDSATPSPAGACEDNNIIPSAVC